MVLPLSIFLLQLAITNWETGSLETATNNLRVGKTALKEKWIENTMKLNQVINVSATAMILSIGMLWTTVSVSSDFGTKEEAKAMLERAVAALKENKQGALEAFTAGTDGFKDRDLYVACFDQGTEEGTLTAHGGLAKLVGTSGYKLIDKKGTNLGKLLDVDTKGEFLVETYWWPRPGATEPVEKESYFVTTGDQNCLVGYYK